RNVVLRLAGDDASTATGAGVQIDHHAPLVDPGLIRVLVKGQSGGSLLRPLGQGHVPGVAKIRRSVRFYPHVRREGRVALEVVELRLAHNGAPFHRPMLLRVGQRIRVPGRFDTTSAGNEKILARAKTGSVEAGPRRHTTAAGATVTERKNDRVIR